jgi:hypothetical protein
MNLDYARRKVSADTFSCFMDNLEVAVEIRSGDGITKLSDLDGIRTTGEIQVIVLSPIRDVATQLQGQLNRVDKGDTLIVYAPTSRVRQVAIHFLTEMHSHNEDQADFHGLP